MKTAIAEAFQILVRPETTSAPLSEAIHWYPSWYKGRAIANLSELRAAVAAMHVDEFGGLRRPHSLGAWSQIQRTGEMGYLVELHPHSHLGRSGGMLFERAVDVSQELACRLAYSWVSERTLLADVVLEQRIVPPGSAVDVPL